MCGLLIGCDAVNPLVVGPQSASGVIRLSEHSFGLLLYPCGRIDVTGVELGVMASIIGGAFTPIYRVTFDQPVSPRDIVV
jgi:hypothetical protein